MPEVEIQVNGKTFWVKEGQNLLKTLLALGFDLPHLCYHETLREVGVCRLCLVKIKGYHRPVASCTVKVRPGLSVITEDEELFKLRQRILELLVAQAPQAVWPETWLKRYQVNQRRFRKRLPENACVLCLRCVRVCEEVLGAGAITLAFRSTETKIATFFLEPAEECQGCLACVEVCPSGAIEGIFQGRRLEIKGLYGTSKELISCSLCGRPFVSKDLGIKRNLSLCSRCRRRSFGKSFLRAGLSESN